MAHVRTVEPGDIVWNGPAEENAVVNIADAQDVLDFLAVILNKLLQGGKRGWLSVMLDIGGTVGDAYSAINGIENVIPALKAMSDEQRTALVASFAERFDIPDDRAELIVERLVNIVLEGFQLWDLFSISTADNNTAPAAV